MTYESPFVRLTWGGSFEAEEEQWSNGLSIAQPGGITQAQKEFLAVGINTLAGIIEDWHINVDAGISNRCRLEWVKIALIDEEGHYIGDADEYQFLVPVNGGSTGAIETQRSLAVSFKTAVRRGPASNGRIYIPAFRIGVATDGRLSTADQTDCLAAALIFIADINSEVDSVLPTAAVSVVSAQGSGAQEPVTSIRVGNVIDSQRRRKNKMIETYVSGAL